MTKPIHHEKTGIRCFRLGPDTNRPVQSQNKTLCLKFWRLVEKDAYNPSSENTGADQLRGWREAGLRLCFRIGENLVFS